MANIVYNQFMLDLAEKKIDLETDLFKVRLCMNFTVAGGDSSQSIDDTIRRATSLTVLDGIDGTDDLDGIDMFGGTANGGTYVIATDDTIDNPVANTSTTGGVNRVNWTGNNVVWTGVSGGARNIAGALVYWQPSSGSPGEGDRVPVCYIDFSSDIVTDSSDITIKWDGGASSGNILRMAQA